MQNHGGEAYALHSDPPKAIDHNLVVRQFEACALEIDLMLNKLVQGLQSQLINFLSFVFLLGKFLIFILVMPILSFFSLEVRRLEKAISLTKEDYVSFLYGRPVNCDVLRANERQVLILSIDEVNAS